MASISSRAFSAFRLCRLQVSSVFNRFQNKALSENKYGILYTARIFFTKHFLNNDRQHFLSNKRSLPYAFGFMGVSRAFLGFGKTEKEDPVLTVFRDGKAAQMTGDYIKAEKFFHDALKLLDEQKRNNKIEEKEYLEAKTNIYDSMSDMALAQGQFSAAESLYKETMKCCLQLGVAQDDNSIIEISVKLASIYAMLKKHADAVQGFKFCIDTQEKKIKEKGQSDKDTLGLLGLALESYGRYLMYDKQLKEAQPHFERALEIAKRTLGEDHMQTLILMNDLATLDIMNKEYSRGEKYLREAIEIGERVHSPETPVLYCNLGAIFIRRADAESAKKMCSHALETAKKIGNVMAINQAKRCLEKTEEMKNKKG